MTANTFSVTANTFEELFEQLSSDPAFVAEYHRLTQEENARLHEEINGLRAELRRIKPSWDDAPEWAQFYTTDQHGAGAWHAERPEPNDYAPFGWGNGGKWQYAKIPGNWRETLEERPK